MAPLPFKSAVTLTLSVRDRNAAADWYRDKLGFARLYDVPDIGFCELSTHIDGVTLGLAERETIEPGGFVPTFEVTDLPAARAILEDRAVLFDGPTFTHEGMVRLAAFLDTDGHRLMLAEDLRG